MQVKLSQCDGDKRLSKGKNFLIMHVFLRIISLYRWCRGNYIFIWQRNEGDLFHRLWHIMNEILDLRRQVLVGHLTHDRMKDVKRHITARLDWGNEWVNINKWNGIKLESQCLRLIVECWNKQQIPNKCYLFILMDLLLHCFYVHYVLTVKNGLLFYSAFSFQCNLHGSSTVYKRIALECLKQHFTSVLIHMRLGWCI